MQLLLISNFLIRLAYIRPFFSSVLEPNILFITAQYIVLRWVAGEVTLMCDPIFHI